MRRLLPLNRSAGWLKVMITYGILLTFLLWINRFVVLGTDFTVQQALSFLILSFVLAAIVNGLGWIGAHLLWYVATAGILIGLIIMAYYSSNHPTGWDDLASFLGFGLGVVFGIGIGLLVEGIAFLIRLRKKD